MTRYHESIGERVRRVRLVRNRYLKDKACTMENFAKGTGVKLTRLKKIESGEIAGILLEEGQVFSNLLGVSSEYIITGETTVEDNAKEKILFTMQIGSMIHEARMRIRNKNKGKGSLREIAGKLGITDMDLLRIENLNKSHYYNDENFLRKLSEVLDLDLELIAKVLEISFPRGVEKRKTAYTGKEIIVMLRKDGQVAKIKRFPVEIDEKDYEKLIKRLELELELM